MKNGRSVVAGLVGSSALLLSVAVVACSSSAKSTGGVDSGASGGSDGGADVTTGGSKSCTTDSQCTPPATSPANCATGSCNTVTGTCTFKAKDADGDGHAAANCKASNGMAIQEGDDCDDTDPKLYPGHPEACTTSGDGGTSRLPNGGTNGACKTGQVTCLAGGGISACAGEVAACSANETCIDGACTGQCGPGQTQCAGDTALETCKSDGTWGAAVPCTNSACRPGDAGTGSASCGGVCSPGALQCGTGAQANYVQTCSATGTWSTATVPCTDICTTGQCGGNCVPGQTECGTSNNILTCPASGMWPMSGGESCGTIATGGNACVSTGTPGNPSAACQGTCVPGAPGSCGPCGKGTESCTSAGAPGACSGDVAESTPCGVSTSCQNGTSHCGGACTGDTTNFGAACGSCGGTVTCGGACSVNTPGNYGTSCGTCGGTYKCDGTSCTRGSTGGSGGPVETFHIDFNDADCTAGVSGIRWNPDFGTTINDSGTYTVNYTFTDHNNMSGSGTPVFYIGCTGSPTTGNANGYSEFQLAEGTVVGSLTCPTLQGVYYTPTLCGQSGSCCGDPAVSWNITGWTSNNAICEATP